MSEWFSRSGAQLIDDLGSSELVPKFIFGNTRAGTASAPSGHSRSLTQAQ